MIKILYAEDEESLAFIVKDSLELAGFSVDWFTDGKEAILKFKENKYDILVLDVMMPEMDGFSLAKSIRKINKNIPIIFLTAKSNTEDVVEGFEVGGNDYLKKPFSIEELIVRIKALINRFSADTKLNQEEFKLGEYTFNFMTQTLSHQNFNKQLTHRESELLKLLIEHKNSVLDRKETLNALWGDDDFFNARSMDVFITKLRKYLKYDVSIQILNIRGVGYKLLEN